MGSRVKARASDPLSKVLGGAVRGATLITSAVLLFLIGYIVIKGAPNVTKDLFAWEYNSENVSLLPALLNTVLMTVATLVLAVPIGVFSAIYLAEYAKSSNWFVRLVRTMADTLSGIPSIVYGLFGMIFFVTTLKLGLSLVSGALTLTFMVLPLIMRTTEEALLSVPDTFREGSYGLGAGKLRTVFKIILPSAMPGIAAGIVLAIGRIVGETAALMYTAGTVAKVASGADFLTDSTRTLAVHMYTLSSEGLYVEQSYATALVLLVIVILINWTANRIAKKLTRGDN